MSYDVFISYASVDKAAADAVCNALEKQGIRCWIAPRDIVPGSDWGGTIIEAMESVRLMVLIFSSATNASPHVEREVERAVNKHLRVVPLRIEDVLPAKSLEYFLATSHWMDAIHKPFSQHLDQISQTVATLLDHHAQASPESAAPPAARRAAFSAKVLWSSAGAVLLIVALLVTWWLRPSHQVVDKFVGTWSTTRSIGPDTIESSIKVNGSGNYRFEVDFTQTGKVEISEGQVYLTDSVGESREIGPVAPGSDPPMVANLAAAAPAGFWALARRFSGSSPEMPPNNPFKRQPPTPGSPLAVWIWRAVFANEPWRVTFSVDSANNYSFVASAFDMGSFSAYGGHWNAESRVRDLKSSGDYSFINEKALVITGLMNAMGVSSVIEESVWQQVTETPVAQEAAASPAIAASPGATITSLAAAPIPSPEPSEQPSAQPSLMVLDKMFILSRNANLYQQPDIMSSSVAQLRKNQRVHVTGLVGNWFRVAIRGNKVGFVPISAFE